MWTKSKWVIIYIRINLIIIPIFALPFRCFGEIIEGIYDFISLFKPLTRLVIQFIGIADGILEEFQAYGNLDLVEVDVQDKNHRVVVKIKMR